MDNDIEYFRLQYKRQNILKKYVNNRVLYRPNTKKWQVAALFMIFIFLLCGIIFFSILLPFAAFDKIWIGSVCIFVLTELHLRFCLIQTIKCYQHYAKEETRRKCKCIPSCSEYAILVLRKFYPLFLAILKIRKRLFCTCNGKEYKVDFPDKRSGERFENRI